MNKLAYYTGYMDKKAAGLTPRLIPVVKKLKPRKVQKTLRTASGMRPRVPRGSAADAALTQKNTLQKVLEKLTGKPTA